jgi:ATP-dependent DNA helicase RecG
MVRAMPAAPSNQNFPPLARPVTTLWGVGGERAAQLARLRISTVEDLLLHRPRRYEDRRHFRAINELTRDEPATARGTIVAQGLKRFRGGTRSVFELILNDGTARLHCRWWNLPFMEKYFAIGDEVFVFGKLVEIKPRTMDHPETEVIESGEENFIHINRIAPVYPLTEGLPQRWLRGLIWRTLAKLEPQIQEPSPAPDAKNFPARANAVHMLHFPEELADVEIARQRLAFDEFVSLQRQIRLRRRKFEAIARALPCGGDNHLIKPFLNRLGFTLTGAQTRVLREIRADLRGRHPMRRLLQGDVGSGKTVVAACATLMALESGYDVALMAPTEILAGQHFQNFRKWFEPLRVPVDLHTGAQKTVRVQSPKSKARNPQNFSSPPAGSKGSRLVVGTHALLENTAAIERLGLVVIDEQHKFGVSQRERLVRKGRYPHLLVMTATPIPRTLGLTVYGELDISVIDQLPPGRGRIQTFVRSADRLPRVWSFLREKLVQGRQAYVVYPRVEETGSSEVKAVTREFANLERVLAPFHVGLLHGRMKSVEKEETMAAFRANNIQVLLATSLIEVGVDVPNATLMLIENAERFGLTQLHQLRGRIGRGAQDSYCILIAPTAADEAVQERLNLLETTTDGFRLAEADLKLRGPGELLGRQQSGAPDFRFGDLATDGELIKLARQLTAEPGSE